MAAAEGNKYAEKWTRELTLEKLSLLLKEAENTKVYYIGQGLANIELYHEWFSYVTDKFKDDEEVFHTIKRIEQAFESKLVNKTLEGELNPTMAIFTLKNKHLWKDKTEVQNDTNLNFVNWEEIKTYAPKS